MPEGQIMQTYSITLQNEKRKAFKTSFLVFTGLNLVAFLILIWIAGTVFSRNIAAAAAMLIIICLILYSRFPAFKKDYCLYTAAGIAAVTYILLGYYGWGVAQVPVLLFFIQAVREPVLIVSDTGVSYPSFPAKRWTWQQLQNVRLKDGLLTVDLKNNKLIQHEVDEIKTSVNETEFNDFCRAQLQSAVR